MTDKTLVLLVEDNELNRDMMTRRLRRAGLEVVTAGNGQQALNIMRADQPDVVLMDMNLPILDGWTASRQAKADDSICHLPIIALTAHAMESDRLNALEAGCDDYDTKPIDLARLIQKMDHLLAQHTE